MHTTNVGMINDTSHAQPRPLHPLRIALIEGSLGYRKVVSAFLHTQWPNVMIEAVDPYSQTMRGAGVDFGRGCDAIILGGVGTRAEALNALARLRANAQHAATATDADVAGGESAIAPLIFLVSHELASIADSLIAAGAAAVLNKDALSRQSLIDALVAATPVLSTAAMSSPAPRNVPMSPRQYGKFAFNVDAEPVVLAIEHYDCVATLASNPLANVFLAERMSDKRRAVVKIPLNTPYHDPAEVQVFCDRYVQVSSLDGDGVVRHVDAGIAGSWPYVVLEHLTGGDLRKRMATGVTIDQATRILDQLAIALATFHGGQLAHMDIKPENIFFREDGSMALIDFNISTRFGKVANNQKTRDVHGSPYYMSPEQGQGLPADGRSDLYSAGVIYFEMLTGARPFAGDNPAQVIYNHIHAEIPLLPKRIRELQPIIDRLLAKNPDERFGSASALSIALRPLVGKYRDGNAPATVPRAR